MIAMTRGSSIQNFPTKIPENAETHVNISHWIIPTFPFALSLSCSGIRRVTSGGRAIIRIFQTTCPIMMRHISIHIGNCVGSCQRVLAVTK